MINGEKILKKLNQGLWQAIKAVFTANRDYPYHDFETIEDGSEPVEYQVGKNNKNVQGTQAKLFVSKSTLVFSDVECTIHLNSPENTPITIRAQTFYTFFSNIRSVYVAAIATGGYIDLAFEGVLPEETRSTH